MLETAPAPVHARGGELCALEQLLQSAADGRGGGLALIGAAGVGKSTLLRALAGPARIVRMAAAESEQELPYSGLHLLCGRIANDLGALHAPQREALEAALGMRPAAEPNPFLIGLGVLSLLAAAGAEEPVACVIDDAHWLDEASARTLGLVARRLATEPVALIFALRERSPSFAGLAALPVHPLDAAAARALFDRLVPGSIDPQVRDRLIAEARGNPRALHELARGMTPARLAGGFALVRTAPRLEQDALARLATLPASARLLLVLAAADPTGDPGLLWRAGERLSLGPDTVDAAVFAGELSIGTRVEFSDPLVRAAVYRDASADDRRRVHAALAQATSADDADRRAWHLAGATRELDERVAEALECSAARARTRAGVAAAAAFLERAAALTPDGTRRARRLLAAAEATYEAGAPRDALALLDSLELAGPRRLPAGPRRRVLAGRRRACPPAPRRGPLAGGVSGGAQPGA
jgi:hypothetical protein